MSENSFEILSSKYLTAELSDVETSELENLVKSNEYYQQKFKESIYADVFIEESKAELNPQEAFKDFLNVVETPKRSLFKKMLGYVAVISGVILSVIGGNFIMNNDNDLNPRTALVIPNEDIILYNENGSFRKVDIDYNKSIKDEFGRIEGLKIGEEITYKMDKIKTSVKTTNHTLKVPFGKKFKITLSDGTKVYLNSGSNITYPTKFDNSKERVVELQGEAFFEVVKNTKKPFIVKTDLLNVRVLGTNFNVSAYKNDEVNSVILVTGKVAVSKSIGFENEESKSVLLKPNYSASIKRGYEDKIVVSPVSNLNKYISWKNKELEFKNDKFIDITKKLERNFNVKIVSDNTTLNNIEFTGNFNKQDVFDILDAFRVHTQFNYTVKNNSIIIKK